MSHESAAASEPNSIAGMALDTNQWKIDLNDLHAGDVRLDFAVPTFADDADAGVELDTPDASEVAGLKPRGGRRLLAAMVGLVVVAGLGLAAIAGRPALVRASAGWNAPQTMAVAAPAKLAAVIAAKTVDAPPHAIASAPDPSAAATQAVPTMNANALPNAPKAKSKPAKRRK